LRDLYSVTVATQGGRGNVDSVVVHKVEVGHELEEAVHAVRININAPVSTSMPPRLHKIFLLSYLNVVFPCFHVC
jgi:hypothetical protein